MATEMTQSQSEEIRKEIELYSEKYGYDTAYMLQMLESNPEAYMVFRSASALASCRKATPLDVYTVVKLAAFQQSDCGACLQLGIRIALEQGMSVELVRGAVLGTPELPPHLQQVRRFIYSLEDAPLEADVLREEICKLYGEAALVELALVVAAANLFPRVKRVMGHFKSCELMEFVF